VNYGELKTAVIEDTHRPDLASLVPRFIREGEGLIRRDMTAYLLSGTLDDTARVSANSPIYNLPFNILFIRRLALQGSTAPGLIRIALDAIGSYAETDRVAVYAEDGTGTIEVRGNPPLGSVFDLNYFGMPAELSDDLDTNSLLDDHETLYKSAAMFHLYQHTQDRELSKDSLDIFGSVIDTLNEQIARKIGGVKITPSYNFHGGSAY